MGLCKSRQSRQTPATAKQFTNKAEYHKEDALAAKSAVKSLARLHDEPPLNPDAVPFVPSSQKEAREIKKAVAAAKGPIRARPPIGRMPPQQSAVSPNDNSLSAKLAREHNYQESKPTKLGNRPVAHVDDPEWMQALARRLAGSNATSDSPQAQPPQHQQTSDELHSGSSPGFVLRTDEYMQLLQGSNDGRARGRGGTKATGALRLPERSAVMESGTAPTAPAGLGQLWTNAFETPAKKMKNMDILSIDAEAAMGTLCTKRRPFCDDTFIERFLDDRDFSERAYWSDGGDGSFPAPRGRSGLVASAHRLRVGVDERNRVFRSYVMQDQSEELDQVVSLLLGRLHCFNEQLKNFDPVSPQRRFFIGLKEVFRRLKQGHVKVLIVAPDLEGSTNLDDRMREVLAYSYQHEVPVIFALSRKRIGLALGKNLNISILGVVDVTGARKLCDEALNVATGQRLAWLKRAERDKRISTAPHA